MCLGGQQSQAKKKEHAESLKKETVLKGRKENKIREEFDF